MDVLFVLALRARFEKLDATPQWGVARIRLDGFDTLRSANGRTATNLAGTFLKGIEVQYNIGGC